MGTGRHRPTTGAITSHRRIPLPPPMLPVTTGLRVIRAGLMITVAKATRAASRAIDLLAPAGTAPMSGVFVTNPAGTAPMSGVFVASAASRQIAGATMPGETVAHRANLIGARHAPMSAAGTGHLVRVVHRYAMRRGPRRRAARS